MNSYNYNHTESSSVQAKQHSPHRRILVMTAVQAEKDAVLRGLQADPRFDVALAGVGPSMAAANTAATLAAAEYSLVVSAGIGGGFVGQAEVGSLVVASEIIAADLGAETPEGFIRLEELGFGSSRIPVDSSLADRLTAALRLAGWSARSGPILTMSTVTGSAETAIQLSKRVPGACAEGMEGYGVAVAANLRGLPVVEIRAISNPVGPRDRANWRIKEALEALEATSSILREVF